MNIENHVIKNFRNIEHIEIEPVNGINVIYGENEKDVYWVAQRDWVYKKSFTLDAKELENEKIILICKRLDTICALLECQPGDLIEFQKEE